MYIQLFQTCESILQKEFCSIFPLFQLEHPFVEAAPLWDVNKVAQVVIFGDAILVTFKLLLLTTR